MISAGSSADPQGPPPRAAMRRAETGSVADLRPRAEAQVAAAVATLRARCECVSDLAGDAAGHPHVRRAWLRDVVACVDARSSVLLAGPPGCGKRAAALGLARAFAEAGDRRLVFAVPLGSAFWVEAGGDAREVDERLREVLAAAKAAGPTRVVLSIEDVDVLTLLPTGEGEGEGDDSCATVENIFRGMVLDGHLVCIVTCEDKLYVRLKERDSFYDDSFSSQFRVIHVAEPGVQEAEEMVLAHRSRLEKKRGVVLLEESLGVATRLSDVYISHRALPEKALDVVDEACRLGTLYIPPAGSADSAVSEKQLEPVFITPEDVMLVISNWCRIPTERLQRTHSSTL